MSIFLCKRTGALFSAEIIDAQILPDESIYQLKPALLALIIISFQGHSPENLPIELYKIKIPRFQYPEQKPAKSHYWQTIQT